MFLWFFVLISVAITVVQPPTKIQLLTNQINILCIHRRRCRWPFIEPVAPIEAAVCALIECALHIYLQAYSHTSLHIYWHILLLLCIKVLKLINASTTPSAAALVDGNNARMGIAWVVYWCDCGCCWLSWRLKASGEVALCFEWALIGGMRLKMLRNLQSAKWLLNYVASKIVGR